MTLQPGGEGVQRSSRLPLYEQLKQRILTDMRNGVIKPGDRLQSEAELCERFGVSRTVVRQTLGELTQQGYIERIQGKGSFVTEPKLRERFLDTAGGFFDDFASRGHAVFSRVVGCREEAAPADVARALQLRGNETLLLERLRLIDGEPLAFSRTYLPLWIHQQLSEVVSDAGLENRSLYSVLEKECGTVIVSAVRRIEAVAANRLLAAWLATDIGSPLLLLRSVGSDGEGRPVEYFESWHRGDRALFETAVDGPSDSAERATIVAQEG